MKLLHKGKVKEVYAFGEDKLLFSFTNQISVFDKIIPTLVPKKGEALCRTSAHWFESAEKLGMRTHFLGLHDVDKMLVRKVDIIHERARITPETKGFFIPLEVICRHYLAGSMHDRVKSGEVTPEQLGFPKGHAPRYGEKLPQPFIEFTTKLEPTDRQLSEDEAFRISGLTEREFADLKKMVLRLDEMIEKQVEPRGLIHVDGKKEFGMNHKRELMVVDTFGTADEDRWWDKKLYDGEGKTVEFSKEMVRRHYRETGYHEALYAARKAGRPEPDIPALPDAVTRQVTALYTDLYTRITGKAG